MSDQIQNYVHWFRHSSPYINAHRGKTFVLMLPGEALQHPNFHHIVYDVALLNSLGVRLVLVHGARPQVESRLRDAGVESRFHGRLRVTDSRSMQWVAEAVGATRTQLESALSTGVPNSPMHGAKVQVISGNFVVAMPHGVIDGIDHQHTGKVRRINAGFLSSALDLGSIALVSPLGFSTTGEAFNLSYSDVATQLAIALKADKLLTFTSQEGVEDSRGQLIRQLALDECRQLLQSQKASLANEVRQALEACHQCCTQGVPRAQVISYSTDGALLTELFTRDGLGTLVHSDSYERLRTATIEDVGGILELLTPLEEQGVLVRRSRERLETEIDRFSLLEKDGTVIACAALYPFGDSAELACVATHPDYRRSGRASALLTQMEKLARNMSIKQLFVLTTQTAHWFMEHGFEPCEVTDLPTERRNLYNYQRNSKVFTKRLAD